MWSYIWSAWHIVQHVVIFPMNAGYLFIFGATDFITQMRQIVSKIV